MNALANPCAVPLPQEGVPVKGAVPRSAAKPQQEFAAAVALVGKKQEGKTEKNVPGKAVAHTRAVGKQGTPDIPKRGDRSALREGQAVTVPVSVDAPADMPVQVKKSQAKGDAALAPVSHMSLQGAPAVKTRPGQTEAGAEGTVTSGLSGSSRPVHGQAAHVPSGKAKENPANATVQTAGSAPEISQSRPAKVEGKASIPVPAAPGHPSSQKPQEGDSRKTASTIATEPGTAEKKEQPAGANPSAVAGRPVVGDPPDDSGQPSMADPAGDAGQPAVAKHPVERIQSSHAEKSPVPAPVASAAPSVAQAASRIDSSAVVRKPDRAIPETTSVRQSPTVEAPLQTPLQTPEQGLPGPRTERRPRATTKTEGTPVREYRAAEIMGLEGKKAQSSQYPEGATAQVEAPVSAIGQSTATIGHSATIPLRASSEAPVQGGGDSGTNPSPVRTVGEQILDSVRTSAGQGEREISVRLRPPELGMVTVRLRDQGDHLEGTVEVGRHETRREIERALPEVVRSLQEAGIPVRRFEVTSSDSLGQDPGRGQPQQNLWSGQQGSGQPREQFPASYTPWSRETGGHTAHSEETAGAGRQISAPPGRIDMLL